MRKSAVEYLKRLEMRVAHLERQAARYKYVSEAQILPILEEYRNKEPIPADWIIDTLNEKLLYDYPEFLAFGKEVKKILVSLRKRGLVEYVRGATPGYRLI